MRKDYPFTNKLFQFSCMIFFAIIAMAQANRANNKSSKGPIKYLVQTVIAITLVLTMNRAIGQTAPAIQWQRTYGGTLEEIASSVKQTSDNGYIMLGYTYSNNGDISGNHGDYDIWVAKTNAMGDIIWQKCFGGSGQEFGKDIQQTSDGGYVIIGYTNSNDGDVSGLHDALLGLTDFWILKLSATGTLEWQKCLGGSKDDLGISIKQTPDGGYIVAGEVISNDGDVTGFHQTVSPLNGSSDIWVVKLGTTGNIEWQKCLGGTGFENVGEIVATNDGGYILTGSSYLSNDGDVSGNHNLSTSDYWVVKISNTGNLLWQKCLGGTKDDISYSIKQTNDGCYIIAGYSTSADGDITGHHGLPDNTDIWVVKLDNLGNIQWQRSLGGGNYEYGFSCFPTLDGGYIIAGNTSSTDGDVIGLHGSAGGYTDTWVVKLSTVGNIEWQKCLGGSLNETGVSVIQNNTGEYVLLSFTYSNDGEITQNKGGRDIWLVKLNGEPPVINSFAPTTARNGVTVTIKGNNFTGTTSVSFGGTAASSFTVVNDSTITAVVGLGSNGNVTVAKVGASGSLAGFTYYTRWHVTQTGSGTKDGSSWANASDDLAKVLAVQAASGDEVWVAQGTYIPKYDVDYNLVNSPYATFRIKPGLKVYGGFVGNETSLTQRGNTDAHATILSGDLGAAQREQNIGVVVSTRDLTAPTWLDGFTIHYGGANGGPAGGNFWSLSCGMVNENGGSFLTINNCTFSNNKKYALVNYANTGTGTVDKDCSPTITNCIFQENVNDGGTSHAIYNIANGHVNNNTFATCNPTFFQCVVRDNTTYTGIRNDAMPNGTVSPAFNNCIIYNNIGNGVENKASGGSTIQSVITVRCNPTFTNCVIANNKRYGLINDAGVGSLYNNECSPTYTNCTITDNGGAALNPPYDNDIYHILNISSSPIFTNCIIWTNTNINSIYNVQGAGVGDISNPTITYSDVYGGCTGIGNINVKPLLVNPFNVPGNDFLYFTGDDGFKAAIGSPTIDAGTTLPGLAAKDITGASRPLGAAYDMGAYEGSAPIMCVAHVPINLNFSNITTSGATVSWTDVGNNTTAWDVYISKSYLPPADTTLPTHTSVSNPHAITGLDYGTKYYCWIRSSCASTLSSWSSNYNNTFITTCLPDNGTPSVSIALTTGQLNSCQGSNVTFTATTSNFRGFPTYQWHNGGVPINGATGATYSTTNYGQQLSCIAMANSTCQNPADVTSNTIALHPVSNVVPSVTISSNKTLIICAGTSVTFTAVPVNGGASPTYKWLVDEVEVTGETATSFTTSGLVNGNRVKCVLTASNTCQTVLTDTSNVIAHMVNSYITPSVTITSNKGTDVCTNNNYVTFTATPSQPDFGPLYQWKLNGSNVGSYSSTNTCAAYVNNNDIVTCTMTVTSTNGKCLNATTAIGNELTINLLPTVVPSVTIASNVIGSSACQGQTVVYSATASNTGGTITYKWIRDGQYIAGETGSTFTINSYTQQRTISCEITTTIPVGSCLAGTQAGSNQITLGLASPVLPAVSITAAVGYASTPVSSPTVLCYIAGYAVTFTATPQNGGSNPIYQWKRNNTIFQQSASATYYYVADGFTTGNDTVTCTLISNHACVTQNVTVSNSFIITKVNPYGSTCSITASQTNFAPGTSVTFHAMPSNNLLPDNNLVYKWYVNNIYQAGNSSNSYTTSSLNNNDVIKAEVTTNVCSLSGQSYFSNEITVTVTTPTSTGTVTLVGPKYVCPNAVVTYKAKAIVAAGVTPVFTWYNNSTIVQTGSDSSYTASFLTAGLSDLHVEVSASGTLPAQSNSIIPVLISNVWTGNSDSDWNNDANWSSGMAPSNMMAMSKDVCIPQSPMQMPTINADITVENVFIENGAFISAFAGLWMPATIYVKGSWSGGYNTAYPPAKVYSNSWNQALIKVRFQNNGMPLWEPPTIYGSTDFETLELDNATGTTIAANAQVNILEAMELVSGNGTVENGGSLTLKSIGEKTARLLPVPNGRNIAGSVTVERYIPAGKRGFRLLSPTVTTSNFIRGNWQEGANNSLLPYTSNQNPSDGFGTHITGSVAGMNGFDATLTGNPSLFQLNNTTQVWNNIANTNATNLIAGNAYRLLLRGNRAFDLSTVSATNTATTLRATGTLLMGNATFSNTSSIPATLPTLATAPSLYSFVGNPYPSSIDWSTISRTGLTGYYWIWDPTLASAGAYVSCFTDGTKSNASSAVTTAIQSGQAFFVVNSSNNTARQLQITEADKTTGNTNVFRIQTGTSSMGIQLFLASKVATGASQDGANILFNTSFSNAVDDEDAGKFNNQEENIAIQRGSSLMSIERRNVAASPSDTVFLKAWQLKQDNYTFRISSGSFGTSMNAYLQDSYLNNETLLNLNGTTDVNFTTTAVAASMAANRFRIVFRGNGALPVSITNLKAYQKNTGIQVEWNTMNELNMNSYELEKSNDGTTFTKVGTVAATGAPSYNWFDASPNKGNNFYRIRLMDKNGTFTYTQVVNVKTGGIKNLFSVAGNPIKSGAVLLQLENVDKGSYTVNVYNSLGQQVTCKSINHAGGSATEIIHVGSLAAGVYQVSIIGKNIQEHKTIIIE